MKKKIHEIHRMAFKLQEYDQPKLFIPEEHIPNVWISLEKSFFESTGFRAKVTFFSTIHEVKPKPVEMPNVLVKKMLSISLDLGLTEVGKSKLKKFFTNIFKRGKHGKG